MNWFFVITVTLVTVALLSVIGFILGAFWLANPNTALNFTFAEVLFWSTMTYLITLFSIKMVEKTQEEMINRSRDEK